MKNKILITIFVVTLLSGVSVSALKARKVETKVIKSISNDKLEKRSDVASEIKELKDESKDKTNNNKKNDDKEVHKRGAFFHGLGGGLASHSALSAFYPRTYASHFGYNSYLPSSASFAPSALSVPSTFGAFAQAPTSLLRYPLGAHYKTGFATLPAATHLHSPAVLPHAHFAASPALGHFAGASHTFLPHAHTQTFAASPAILPAPALAASPTYVSAPPLAAVPAPAPAPAVLPAAPVASPSYVLGHGGAVVSSYSVNYPHHLYQKPAVALQPAIQPVAHVPVAAPAPQPVQPFVPVQNFKPVQPVQPVQPVHHQFVQTTFVQQPTPVLPAVPPAPAIPAQPTFQFFPAFPAAPAVPVAPVVPASPPALPTPVRPFVGVPIQPAAIPQLPVNPLPSTPTAPDTGSAVASPQIPSPPQPELPPPTQNSWKPVAERPSITLMPPYGAPGEAYLPPAPSSPHQQLQQQQLSSHLFDNLTESEIEHIFAQAQAAQQQQQQQHHYHHHNRNSAAYQHY